jgi:hypothetical protein
MSRSTKASSAHKIWEGVAQQWEAHRRAGAGGEMLQLGLGQ